MHWCGTASFCSSSAGTRSSSWSPATTWIWSVLPTVVCCHGTSRHVEVWHAHQASPVDYTACTTSLLGSLLQHDDTVNDRAAGSRLNTSGETTASLWRQGGNTKINFNNLMMMWTVQPMGATTGPRAACGGGPARGADSS